MNLTGQFASNGATSKEKKFLLCPNHYSGQIHVQYICSLGSMVILYLCLSLQLQRPLGHIACMNCQNMSLHALGTQLKMFSQLLKNILDLNIISPCGRVWFLICTGLNLINPQKICTNFSGLVALQKDILNLGKGMVFYLNKPPPNPNTNTCMLLAKFG